MVIGTDKEYKGGRTSMPQAMYDAIRMTQDLLLKAGICCLMAENYEADDLIKVAIDGARKFYPGVPIDVITNDADLLPLVDDTVSVFLRSKVDTYAVKASLEKAHYIQVTPENFQSRVEKLSAYKKFLIPYNSLLLHKLLRGDSSDKISGVGKMFPPKKYNDMILEMQCNGVDFASTFRYGSPIRRIVNSVTNEVVTEEQYRSSEDKSPFVLRYDNPKELDNILEVLNMYVGEEVLEHVEKTYLGMNLNQAYSGFGKLSRKPLVLNKPVMPFSEVTLQSVVSQLGINLNLR
jgi:DNA polymerase-1